MVSSDVPIPHFFSEPDADSYVSLLADADPESYFGVDAVSTLLMLSIQKYKDMNHVT